MNKSWKSLAVTFAAGAAFQALAIDLRPPMTLENALVLPPGVRNPRYIQVLFSEGPRFDGVGGREPLGNRLNRSVSWDDVIASQDDETQKKQLRSVLDDNNLTNGAGPGDATGRVSALVNVKVPALGWGITDRFTLAAALPIFDARVNVDAGFERSADGQKFVDELGKISPLKANEAADKLNAATASKLARLGYEPLTSRAFTGPGDLQIVGKYLLAKGLPGNGAVSLKTTVGIPTGTGPNADRALDVATGEGRWTAGSLVAWDFDGLLGSTMTLYGGYRALLPSEAIRRLPASETDTLSADKYTLRRGRNDEALAGLVVGRRFFDALTVNLSYAFQYRSRVRYDGDFTDAALVRRTRLLEDLEPEQVLHSAALAVNFSTVDWYKKKEFFLPMQINVAYSQPLAGRNVPTTPVITGELVAFF